MKIEDLNKRLDDIFEKYDNLCDETLPKVSLDGSILKEALCSQVGLQLDWERMYANVRQFHDYVENRTDEAYSTAINTILTNNHRSHSITEAREMAKVDSDYRALNRLKIDSNGLMLEIKAILETITTRKYTLNNITNAVIASQENHII